MTAENAMGIVYKHISSPTPVPSKIAPDADKRLEAVCLKAMRELN